MFLLPGLNPGDPADTPIWSVVVSIALSVVGEILWKRWEDETPPEEQFSVETAAGDAARSAAPADDDSVVAAQKPHSAASGGSSRDAEFAGGAGSRGTTLLAPLLVAADDEPWGAAASQPRAIPARAAAVSCTASASALSASDVSPRTGSPAAVLALCSTPGSRGARSIAGIQRARASSQNLTAASQSASLNAR